MDVIKTLNRFSMVGLALLLIACGKEETRIGLTPVDHRTSNDIEHVTFLGSCTRKDADYNQCREAIYREKIAGVTKMRNTFKEACARKIQSGARSLGSKPGIFSETAKCPDADAFGYCYYLRKSTVNFLTVYYPSALGTEEFARKRCQEQHGWYDTVRQNY